LRERLTRMFDTLGVNGVLFVKAADSVDDSAVTAAIDTAHNVKIMLRRCRYESSHCGVRHHLYLQFDVYAAHKARDNVVKPCAD
jgi:hypothetical protein